LEFVNGRYPQITQIKISITFDELIVEMKAMGEISGLEHKRDSFITFILKKKSAEIRVICGSRISCFETCPPLEDSDFISMDDSHELWFPSVSNKKKWNTLRIQVEVLAGRWRN